MNSHAAIIKLVDKPNFYKTRADTNFATANN